MIKAVLDTNVLISALFWKGAPHNVLEKGLRSAFAMLTSQEILGELQKRLIEKFSFPFEDTAAFIEIVALNSQIIKPEVRLRVVKRDPSDDKIVECSVSGNADYIVTGDKHLLGLGGYQRIKIIAHHNF